MSETYYLIEAPGRRWLAFKFSAGACRAFWTEDATVAFRICTKEQADDFRSWMRDADPQRYAFEANLGPAVVTEHMNVED